MKPILEYNKNDLLGIYEGAGKSRLPLHKEINFEQVFDTIIKSDKTDEDGDKYRINVNKYGDNEWISKFEQYRMLQKFAFALEDKNIKISHEFAEFLNEKYNRLTIEAEDEDERDLSGDYMMDFNRWVEGAENVSIYW